jgi:hypothetical protein
MAIFDTHGDMADASAVNAMLQFKKMWKPDISIHGGDAFDLRALRKGASAEEEFEDVQADIDAGLDLMRRYRPDVYLRGNHCERLWDAAQSHNPILSRFASLTIEEVMGAIGKAQMYPYDKRAGVHRMGNLKIIHGYHSGINAARQSALCYGSVIGGHCHVIDAASIPGLERRIGRIAGAMCKLDMPYNRAHANTLRQQLGFAYGVLWPNGNYQYFQAECTDGMWLFPSEMREVKCA